MANLSPDLRSLLYRIAEGATRACGADDATVWVVETDAFHQVAHYGPIEQTTQEVVPLAGPYRVIVALRELRSIHIPDVLADESAFGPGATERFRARGVRTILQAPMVADAALVGRITIRRREVRPFADEEIAQLETYAQLAAVAMDRARVAEEREEKARDLAEALSREQATSEVLRIVGSAPTALQPVFDAIVLKAVEVCHATDAMVRLLDGDVIRLVAHYGELPPGPDKLSLREDTPGPRAVLERRTIYVRDCLGLDGNDFSGVADFARRLGFRSFLAVPLIRDGAALGVINFRHREADAFTPQHVMLLETFASQALIAIENAEQFRQLNERNSELREALEQQTATAEVLGLIARSPTELQPIFDVIVAKAVEVCHATDATVRLAQGNVLRRVAHHGDLPPGVEELPIDGTAGGTALREGRTIYVRDILGPEGTERDKLFARRWGWRSLLTIPLRRQRDEAPLGTMDFRHREPDAFTPQHIALLETFASQGLIAMENARLFNDLKEALEQQTATAAMLAVIASSPTELQPVLDAIAEKAATVCGAFDAVIRLVEDGVLRARAHYGSLPEPTPERAVDSTTVVGRAVAEARTFHLADILAVQDEFPDSAAMARNTGSRTQLATPLKREGQPIGVILIRRAEVRPFSDSQVALLQTFADQAVIAIENVRLFKELHERNAELRGSLERQTATGEILHIISSSPAEVARVYEAIARAAARVLNAPGATVWVRDGDELKVVAREEGGLGRRSLGDRVPISGEGGPSQRAVREGRTVHVPDFETQDSEVFGGAVLRGGRSTGIRSVLSTPMWLDGEPIGAIGVQRAERRPFTADEIALMETFAAQAVIATENVRLFHELEAKNAELEVAGKHKSDFLANMSHELRTPLNAIISFSEIVAEDATDAGHEQYVADVQEITTAGKHLLGLINDILDLSKIEAGKVDVLLEEFDVDALIHEVTAMAQPLVEKNGNLLVVDCPARIGSIYSDQSKVRQSLLNFLSNAAKFTEAGTITLQVLREPTGDQVTFAIRDTGLGMTEEQIERLFEAFSQGTAETSRKYGGTGLGMAITKRFAEMLGGDVTVESQPGVGSTFTLTLPVRSARPGP